MTRPWRFRRCPSCHVVRAASEYQYVGTYRPGWDAGAPAERSCACGYRGPTSDFQVVREVHPEPEHPHQMMLPTAPRITSGGAA